jgi:hypothetical protein
MGVPDEAEAFLEIRLRDSLLGGAFVVASADRDDPGHACSSSS